MGNIVTAIGDAVTTFSTIFGAFVTDPNFAVLRWLAVISIVLMLLGGIFSFFRSGG